MSANRSIKRQFTDLTLPFSPPPSKKPKSGIQFRPFSFFNLALFHSRVTKSRMGNLFSRVFGGTNDESTSCNEERLGFEQYKNLVEAKSDWVVNRKVTDARSVVVESSKRVPVYKRLLEETRRRDGKLSSLELEVKLNEEKIQSLRKAVEEEEEEDQEENLYELFFPLTGEDEEAVYDALYGRDSGKVLVTHENSNIEISKQIIRCLRPGGWLNDEVINLYLELLKEREKREPNKFLNCHFFNTFFYKKLISGKSGYDYKSIKRWTTHKKLGYSLIDCDKIFVPVHKGIHWCLAIINVKNKSFQYLDSLGGTDFKVFEILAKYVMDEFKDKSNIEIDINSWKKEKINGLPMQQNGWDCGMFMLKYIDFLSRGLSLFFSQEHMEYFRKRTAKEILRLRAE
ncbi:hypothetical protein LUZ60_013941 [Juncus effusus]|nr:hypothetical protein LUZ60_013941 [Juncus effusus]